MDGEWEYATIEELPIKIGDGNYSSKYPKAADFVTFGVPFISAGDLKNGKIIPDNFRFISQKQHSELVKGQLRVGDVLIVTRGNGTGGVAWVDSECENCNINAQLVLLRSDEKKVHNKFLYYYLSSRECNQQLVNYASGSAQPQLTIKNLIKVKLKIPSYNEQVKIAKILSCVDEKINQLTRLNQTLENIARALFKSWFVDFDPVRVKMAGREPEGLSPEIAALFPDKLVESPLGMIPEGWEPKSVYSCAEFVNGAAFKNADFTDEKDALPIIKIAELKNGINESTKLTKNIFHEKYLIHFGDILFSWSGSPETSIDIFLWGNETALLNQHIFKVKVSSNSERGYVFFLLKYLKSTFIEIAKNRQTTGLGHVTVNDLKQLDICYPSAEIRRTFSEITKPLIHVIETNLKQSNALISIKNILLPKLISGELALAKESSI